LFTPVLFNHRRRYLRILLIVVVCGGVAIWW
jgi:hypothetical protein